MKGRHVICIVVDGLRASSLGAYGNTSYPTPNLDSAAAHSKVVDWLWADSPRLEGFYEGAWHGLNSSSNGGSGSRSSLLGVLRGSSVKLWLATDDPWLSQQSTYMPFDNALLVQTVGDCCSN